ncbi:hypothetical protein SLEP1_g48542 [Rubroshorea leprosula]|uniref:Ubiquitin-like domain-containing protein n=1 Tax=Rubroshorea leprosula TaxID=152421 RepID=A0AAV5LWU3_9ROSI|nr:hypothetical protein SLEP1_g48542 [Rubroshorea leprosula]
MAQQDDHLSVTLTITGGKVRSEITCPVSSTIVDLKQRINTLQGIYVPRQTLYYNGQEMQNNLQLKDYNVQPSSEGGLVVEPYCGDEKLPIQVVDRAAEATYFVNVKETIQVDYLKQKVQRRIHHGKCTTLTQLGLVMQSSFPLNAQIMSMIVQ